MNINIKRILAAPPLGYKHAFINNEKTIIPNEYSEIIKEAFLVYSKGDTCIRGLVKYLEEKYKLPVPKTTLARSLKNSFYIGEHLFNGTKYKHKFETLTSKKLYNQVQTIISRTGSGKKTMNNPPCKTCAGFKMNKSLIKKSSQKKEKLIVENKIKAPLSVRIDKDLLEKVRNIVYWAPDLTVNKYVESALKKMVLNHDTDIEDRTEKLHRGRKISA